MFGRKKDKDNKGNKIKDNVMDKTCKQDLPNRFPFWARLKISKRRTTLVIDEEQIKNKKTKKIEDGYVHREATHTKKKD